MMRTARRLTVALSALLAIGLSACDPPPQIEEGAAITDPSQKVVRSPHGVVSTAGTLATEAGARVLAQGGNAADAAAAAAFALTVVEPSMSGIAGRASIVIRAPDGQVFGIDGLNEVPAGFGDGGGAGYERAATPGALAALGKLVDEHGSWPLERVLEPAIRLARDGFPIHESEASRIRSAREALAEHPGSRAAFLDAEGNPPQPGDTVVFADYARVLQAIADEGIDVFYRGWIADSIHADMERSGGFITRDDLARYEARAPILVQGEYRGYRLHSNFRPSSGHTVIQALQTLEALEEPLPGAERGVEWAALVGQAMRLALRDRGASPGATEEESAAILTSREWASERAADVRVPAPVAAAPASASTATDEPQHTTHLSAVDRDGMAVALTQSLGPSLGTRVVSPGLGFPYATRLGSRPGSRPSSTIAPTIVVDENGQLSHVLGAANDARIITSVIQVLSRSIDHGLPLDEAMAAPRVHPVGEATLYAEEGAETGWTDEELESLEALGFEVETRNPGYFGWPHAIGWEADASAWIGVAEPRRWGGAAAPLR